MRTIISMGMIILLITCCKKLPPEIVKMEGMVDISFQNDYGDWQKYEYFMVFNPPKDLFDLAKLIADYNAATMNKGDILKYAGLYRRTFYKETYRTMEMYKAENSKYAGKMELYAEEDRIFFTDWSYSLRYAKEYCGIEVDYVLYNGDTPSSWNIYNAEGDEIFYPWLRENPEGK